MLLENIQTERDKYLWIYRESGSRSYGKRNHGGGAYNLILEMKPLTLLDVGCGKGLLVEWAKKQGIDAEGMDFASGYGVCGDILDMPFPDNSFEIVTAFDVLEHLRPEDLNRGLEEMSRVAIKKWIFSIGYGPSKVITPDGPMQLHPISTRDKNWWTPILSRYGELSYWGQTRRGNPYIIVELAK